ncbi:hypothetical protein MAR_033382 [Mya arenaria]|uniref:Uncharacterized protein n=1 Tax=Mya arenaria TaxID=6604 RepID=A0ABY7G9N6_MYAAR|nr:hypothetical protein MAR_033382 [Mya arenaria]
MAETNSVFCCENGNFTLTDTMKRSFDDNGKLFSNEEVKHIENALTEGPFQDYTYGVADGEGGEAHMILWQHPGNDVTGMVGRCEKVAGTCDMLLEGEILV